MNRLPEPPARQPHATQAGQPPINPAVQAFLADLEDAFAPVAPDIPAGTVDPTLVPTSYRDPRETPTIGTTPPVPQPDSRRVPAWATGIAVASIGIGTGATGIGCAAWLAMKGLSMATLNGVLMVAAPFAGIAVVVLAAGAFLGRAKKVVEAAPPVHHHHYNGDVQQQNVNVHSTNRGIGTRTHNEIPPNSR